jgi:capsular exopolysaccharide synthesis family protein
MGPQRTQNPAVAVAPDLRQTGGAGPGDGESTLAEALATLRKRLWVLIVAAVLGLSYGTYKAYTQPKIYEAWSTIQVHNGAAAEYKLNAVDDYNGDSQTKMNTEVAILTSEALMYTVASEMDLANNPDFSGPPGPVRRSIDDPAVRASVVGRLQTNLHVALIPRTELIRIGYSSLSPKLSAEIVRSVVRDYIQRSFETPVESTKRVSEWLTLQLDQLKTKVEQSQSRMMELQRRLGALGYDSTHNQLSASLEGLLEAEGTAKIARINAESRYQMVAHMDEDTIGGSIETTPGTAPAELTALRAQIAAAKANYAQLAAGGPGGGLGPNLPQMKALQAQIDEQTRELKAEQSRMLLQSKEAYLATKAAEEKTEQELDAKREEAYRQGDDLVQYTLLQREFEQDRSLYDGLEQRLRTAELQAGLDAAEVDVIDAALPPVDPTLQPPMSIILTNAALFLLVGVVLAFLLESLDTRLHNIGEIEAAMELPSLAIIPRSKPSGADRVEAMSAAQRNINVLTQPKSQFTEAFRALRTSLLLATAGQPPKLILFTSATPSEGKTTIASNLACVLAQGDNRVLLIDADLRRPNVHHRFGLLGKLGLVSVLAGTATFEETVQHVPEVPNLDILPSGPVPPWPTEMLSSEAMRSLLERLGGMYAHIVIDSPPILSVTDGVILARVVDAVVLVIRHGKSSKHIVQRARDLLLRAGAPIAGLVLNAVDLNSPDYYGYYGYSGYSYGSADAETWETQPAAEAHMGTEGEAKR